MAQAKSSKSPRVEGTYLLLNSRTQVLAVAELLRKAGMTIPPPSTSMFRINFTDHEAAQDALEIVMANRAAVAMDLQVMVQKLQRCADAQGPDTIGRAFEAGIKEMITEAGKQGYEFRQLADGTYRVRY